MRKGKGQARKLIPASRPPTAAHNTTYVSDVQGLLTCVGHVTEGSLQCAAGVGEARDAGAQGGMEIFKAQSTKLRERVQLQILRQLRGERLKLVDAVGRAAGQLVLGLPYVVMVRHDKALCLVQPTHVLR